MNNRKFLLAVLAAMLAVSVLFAGCMKKDDNSSSSESSSQQNSSMPNDNSSSTSPNNDGSNDTIGENIVHGAISLKNTIENIYNNVMNGADDWLSTMDEENMKTAYEMDFSNFEEFYGRIPKANVHATSVIGVKAKPGKKEQAKAELMKYEAAMEHNFERYLPEQYDMVKDYRIVEDGDYLILVIAENADDIEKELGKVFDEMKKKG